MGKNAGADGRQYNQVHYICQIGGERRTIENGVGGRKKSEINHGEGEAPTREIE